MAAVILVVPFFVGAVEVPVVSIEQFTADDYFYPNTFDNLVLDFNVNSVDGDIINDLVVKNAGSAKLGYEFATVSLWLDDGNGVFDGFGIDENVKSTSSSLSSGLFVFDDIDQTLVVGDNRFFVSVEVRKGGTAGRVFDFYLPKYYDQNANELYDVGDLGFYLEVNNILPTEDLNPTTYTRYKTVAGDPFDPVIVIDNIEEAQVIAESSYVVTGIAKDQGGSFVDVAELCLDGVCNSVIASTVKYATWEYELTGLIEGTHEVYAKATDFNNNIGVGLTYSFDVVFAVEEDEEVVAEPPLDVDPALFSVEYSTVALSRVKAQADGIDYIDVKVTLKNGYDEPIARKGVFLNEQRTEGPVVVKAKYTDSVGYTVFRVRDTKARIVAFTISTDSGEIVTRDFLLQFLAVEQPIDYNTGRWVKLDEQKAVYFLDSDNVRHAYPTQAVWVSYWGEDFSAVETITTAEMAGYALGRNVPFNVGTLIKIPSVSKVYYVSYNGVIAWITDADVAKSLLGANWIKSVRDLPESFFLDYVVGSDISEI